MAAPLHVEVVQVPDPQADLAVTLATSLLARSMAKVAIENAKQVVAHRLGMSLEALDCNSKLLPTPSILREPSDHLSAR